MVICTAVSSCGCSLNFAFADNSQDAAAWWLLLIFAFVTFFINCSQYLTRVVFTLVLTAISECACLRDKLLAALAVMPLRLQLTLGDVVAVAVVDDACQK